MKRWLLSTVLPLGAALGLALAAAVTWMSFSSRPSLPVECPPWDIPLARDKSLGINADLSILSGAARAQALDSMSSSGFRWLRQRFPWDRIEKEQGSFDWALWDGIVGDVTRQGMNLVAILDGSPVWARGSDDAGNPLAPPREMSDYGAFVAAFAGRYGAHVDYYEVWDEPNIAPHWGNRWVNPAEYARMLREGAIQLRTADPGAVVVLAALAPNAEAGGANMSDVAYLDELYAQGADEWFDVVAAEPYGFAAAPSAPAAQGRLSFSRAELLRGVMRRHNDETTPIWAAAFGWADDTSSGQSPMESLRGAVDYARTEWPWMGPMFWAAWSPDEVHGQYAVAPLVMGMSTRLDLPGSSWEGRPVATAGWFPADHGSGTYEGKWRVTPEGADIGATGDSLSILFSGTRLDLTVHRGDYRAFLFVTVDGQPSTTLPRDDAGRSYVVLYDPNGQEAGVKLAEDLEPGMHVAHIVAEGGWGQWAIVGWSSCTETRPLQPWLPIGLMSASLLALALSVRCTWPQRKAAVLAVRRLVEWYRALDTKLAWLFGVAAGVCLYASDGTVPSLAVLALLAILLLLRPEIGPALIAVALPFWQLGKPLLGKLFSMVEILTWLTVVAWIVHSGLRLAAKRHSQPSRDHTIGRTWLSALSGLDWGVLALVLVGAMSLVWAEHTREAARELRTVVLGPSAFFLLLRAFARRPSVRWLVVDAWVLGGVLISLVALAQGISGRSLITAEGVWRVRGFYGSPNNLALYLGRLLPVAVAVGLWGERGQRRWLYGVAGLLMSLTIVLTHSRGAWLLGVPASLLFLFALRGRRLLLIAVGVLTAALVLALTLAGPGRLASLTDFSQGTTFLRLQLWKSSLSMIRDHPLLGLGLDNFLYAYRTTYVLPTAWEELNLSHPHNIVLDFWLRLGLPGLAVAGILIVQFFRQGIRAYRRQATGDIRPLILGLMGGMVNFGAHGLVDNAFFLVDLAYVFMLMLACVRCLAVPATGSEI